jgi:hypothetical protein
MPQTTTVLPHVKIAWGGSIGTPSAEVWTNSIAWVPKGNDMSGVTSQGLTGLQAQMGGLSTAIQNWFQDPIWGNDPDTAKGAGICPDAKLEWVKCNAIGADGKYLFASNTFFYPAPIPGGGTQGGTNTPSYQPPWQMTTAITLRTTVARGRGSKGRIYPPLAGGPPDPGVPYQNLKIVTQMTNGFTGLLDNINAGMYVGSGNSAQGYDQSGIANDHYGNCVIVSTMPHTGPHAGAAPLLTPILSVEVDRVADVQTRRVDRIHRSTAPKQLVTLNT